MSVSRSDTVSGSRYAGLHRSVGLLVGGVALVTVSAKVQVPFWPVPMTLQTLAILLISASYGMRLASSTLAAYLLLGAAGFPVFANGGGLLYVAGPTGGYLAGFLIGACLVGWLSDHGFSQRAPDSVIMMLIGELAIFLPGVAWLGVLFGPDKALAGGLSPFILAEVLKVLLACAAIRLFRTQPVGSKTGV
ncbi:biotin transporter BioY [Mesorhizobium sp. M1D.F.Ca.ET.043.01.1.1]|uniref:biotin transporter BioY n=1 Tax=Mesorhizobium sp. M1D.F.Ca.ET.043.01.1.1 TaxID=2493669 RepID=UPI000F75D865|nr:biotin transporter BioY [Mesorhizobium sp. M1D.F.Ca.ET.043.01.1.1]AZO73495.1 biotin transporter BioY [Mesorhizobium sp. M1D.F.Ca.ET.043.01.1.1]